MKVDKTQFYSGNKRHLKEKMSEKSLPLSSYPMTQLNNRYLERPLKNNSENLSFKGLSFMGVQPNEESKKKKQINPTLLLLGLLGALGLGLRFAPSVKEAGRIKISDFKDFTSKYVDNIGVELLEDLKGNKFAKKFIEVTDNDEMILYKKTIPQLIWDGLKYPFTILPGDLLNGSVKLLGKFKPLKKWSDNVLDKELFRNIRQRSKIDAKINSLLGFAETQKNVMSKLGSADSKFKAPDAASDMFQRSVKMFDTEKYGAYDTKHERALNRLVSGLPPAIYLANDAYNLSRMMDDDPKKADKEKKTRFNQETTRILTSGYLTLVTLGALNKYINNNKIGIMLMTGLTVLFTEAFSRLSNGKHITRLTPEEARAENEKNNAPEKNIKPDKAFKANTEVQKEDKPHQKPLLSFDTLMKGSAIVIAGGLGIKGLKHFSPAVKKMFKIVQEPFQNLYKKLTVIPEYTIPETKFASIIKVMEDNNYNVLASKYNAIKENLPVKIVEKEVNGKIEKVTHIVLGKKDRKYAKPAVNFIIAPFKFAYNTVTLPYKLVNKIFGMVNIEKVIENLKIKDGPLADTLRVFFGNTKKLEIGDKHVVNIALEGIKKAKELPESEFNSLKQFADNVLKGKILAKDADTLTENQRDLLRYIKDCSVFAKSIENIGKKALEKGITPKEFRTYVNDNINKAFNVTTMSNVSNAELSNLAKTAAAAATIWFLMTDNYNMVMLKSNGNDKEGAETKFKERFVQEGSRLFYQTLLIDLFNSTFRTQYNGSLAGMSLVTLVDTTLGEILTRKSVGMPTGIHTRDELEAIEKRQNEATGFLKGYYNFMRRLTGKRSIESYSVSKKDNVNAVKENPINFTNNRPTLDKMLKA